MDPALLPALAWFTHIATHRSFTKAANEAGVSKAALSQSLKTLERQLDVKLLYRTTRDMSLTEDGQRLFDSVSPALDIIERSLRELSATGSAPSGLLRISTSHVAAKYLIQPHLAELGRRYPELKLELMMDDRLSNIVAEGADAGIRLGESLAEHMIAVPISPKIELVVAGSPAYFERNPIPRTPTDLASHNCVGFRSMATGAIHGWEFTSPEPESHEFSVSPQGAFITNDDEAMIDAALQGVGLVQHMDIALRRHLESGRLVPVLQDWSRPFPGFYIYAPSRDQMPAKVRALIDLLVEMRSA